MHTELSVDIAVLSRFIVVLARVSGFILLVPLPGMNAAPNAGRIVLAVALTLCMVPLAPAVKNDPATSDLLLSILAQFAVGLVMGLCLALLLEAFQLAAQVIGLQAGFSYASTIDPSTQADTSVLQTILQLFTGMLFLSSAIHLEFIRLLALGLDAGTYAPPISKLLHPSAIVSLGTLMLATGLRLAMPVIGSLLLVDLAFALLSKVHSQLQLLSLSFSVKMLAGLGLVAATLIACPTLLYSSAGKTLETLLHLLR